MIEAKCETCKGTGQLYGNMAGPCPTCGGSGKWPRIPRIPQAKPSVRTSAQRVKCNKCDGTGLIHDEGAFKCDACHGVGSHEVQGWFEATGQSWPGMELDASAVWAKFEKTEFARVSRELKAAVEAHPDFKRMRHQRNCCFWLAVALTLWTLLSLFVISKLTERLL